MTRDLGITYLRRNHLVGRSGVGSLISNQEGVTVLLAGLPMWIQNAGLNDRDGSKRASNVERALEAHEISDFQTEARLGVNRLIQPPVMTRGTDNKPLSDTWWVPAVRFPLWEFCTRCGSLSHATNFRESPSPRNCDSCRSSGRKSQKMQQVPVLTACKAGHLSEIDWRWRVHGENECANPAYRLRLGGTTLHGSCECGRTAEVSTSRASESASAMRCSGHRPWLPGKKNEPCEEKMRVFSRQSNRVYYPDIDSSLHLPAPSEYSQELLDFLQNDSQLAFVLRTPEALPIIVEKTQKKFAGVSQDVVDAHIRQILSSDMADSGSVRESELQALTDSQERLNHFDILPVLDTESKALAGYNSVSADFSALFDSVVAVHRLAETRVLKGFTRDIPPERGRTGATALQQLWGFVPKADDPGTSWLPAHRVFGEGIFFELNSRAIDSWQRANVGNFDGLQIRGYLPASPFVVAHTLAHAIISAAAQECGYHVASIRDRIYFDNGRYGFLVYTAEGDSVGTMGGLVELAEPGRLENVIEAAIADLKWCGLDPVCISPAHPGQNSRSGACHRCVYLPETSCEWFNLGLDRASLIGNRDGVSGYFGVAQRT